MIERINAEALARPSGFTHAVAVTGERLVFLSGQTAQDQNGRIVGEGVVEQFEHALANLLAALSAAGGGDLVDLTIYIVDMDDYKAHRRRIGAVWRRLVGTEYPATAGVGVARLWDAEALVELSGVAVRAHA
jgi:enamine deaminase RidA (YjgF/YER057c/UK114 family)